jgi:hypothetical protein
MKSDKGLIFVLGAWLTVLLLSASVVIWIIYAAFHFMLKYW